MLECLQIDPLAPLLVCCKPTLVGLGFGTIVVCVQLCLGSGLWWNALSRLPSFYNQLAIYASALQPIHDCNHALVRFLQCSQPSCNDLDSFALFRVCLHPFFFLGSFFSANGSIEPGTDPYFL